MKIFILIFIFISSMFGACLDEFASDLNYSRDYNSAVQVAKKEHKMLMLVIVADYCPWCKKFERKTLKNDLVDSKVKMNFIPLIIDKHRDEGNYPDKFHSPLIPTTFFIDPDTEESMYKSMSYITKRDFLYNIDEAIKLFNEKQK